MATIFAANESAVLIDGEPILGIRSLEYRRKTSRRDVYAVGSPERVGVVSGPRSVEGKIRVASRSNALDERSGDEFFQLAAQLREQGGQELTVSFDECLLVEKSFEMGAGGHGEAVYEFTATRVREEA